MAPLKKGRQDAGSATQPAVTCEFRIPCFAHQHLDTARFPEGRCPTEIHLSYHVMSELTYL
jgi:hypothetical protein